jgi:hypothetical protein
MKLRPSALPNILAALLSIALVVEALAGETPPTTTSTSLPSEALEEEVVVEKLSATEASRVGAEEAALRVVGSCTAQFFLESEDAWVDLRMIAAYDRRLGAFKSGSQDVNCTRSRAFESATFENQYGVLQASLNNAESLVTVSGPTELFSCEFGYTDRRPALDDFILQVQAAHTIVPVEIRASRPQVSMSLHCE